MSDKDKRSAFTTVVMSDIKNNTQEVVYNSYTLPLLIYDGTDMTKNIEKIEAVPDKGITIQNDIIFYDNTYASANDTFENVLITMKETEGTSTHTLKELINNGYTITPFISGDGGGGGSSDFSTAKVTIQNRTRKDVPAGLPIVMTKNGITASGGMANVRSDFNGVIDVILSQGKCIVTLNTEKVLTVTGNITYDDGLLTITGDGTITVADSSN